jgi:hypothetical protein
MCLPLVVSSSIARDTATYPGPRVLEVDGTSLTVGQAAVLEDLQQRVEHVRVGLLDLVEEDHRERPPADLLGQLTTLVVTDVSGRRTDETGHRVLVVESRYVQLDQRGLAIEQEPREGLGQLRFSDTGGAGEDERTRGPLRVLQSGPGPADRPGHRLDRVVLADEALVQLGLHAEQPGRLLLGQLEDRDARPVPGLPENPVRA